MDTPESPAAAAQETEVKCSSSSNNDEQEGDSGDEVPEADRPAPAAPAASSSGGGSSPGPDAGGPVPAAPARVSPYSVIDIRAFQEAPGPEAEGDGVSLHVPSGYVVPVPCGYAVPCSLPALLPAYASPVVVCAPAAPEDEAPQGADDGHLSSLSSEDPTGSEDPARTEDSALARWAADPANTAWMESPEGAIYDDVPRENSDSEPDEMIYDDVENGDEGGNSSLEYGWSSSEFESYEEQSDPECKNGVPRSFLRSNHKKQMQKLVKAAKEGTKDRLEKTKAAVKRGRSFIRTKSFVAQDHRPGPEEEQNLFIDVDCRHPEAVLTPMPEGLSQQQVARRHILGSIVDSEKKYVDALRRILEDYERPLSEMEPRMLSDRKLKVVFRRVREVLQCHCMFQIALASRVAEWDSVETIGDVFVASFSKSMVLDAYSEYVNNFSTAVAILRRTCATKPAFLEFLKQSQEASPDGVTLCSLMVKPIQRFPQFILLLQDMLRSTPRGHPDRLPLQMALTELETLAAKLNERKRDADQRCEIKQVAKAVNERYLHKLLSSGSRYLIRSDDMIETVYNDRGEVTKTRERRLFMLNDVLMCATLGTRGSHDGGALMPPGQRCLLKWSVPLGHVEVVEYGGGGGDGQHSRGPTAQPPESLAAVASAKPHRVDVGPGQLYRDLQNLLHDLNVVGQIAQLIGDLKGHYQNLSQAVAHDWTSGLQRLILGKEEEIRAAGSCRLQLQLPGKPDRSGRPVFFTAVFSTFTPAAKDSWVSSLHMAKLALEEENHVGWFCTDDDGNQVRKERQPLLVGRLPVTVAKQQEFKIECAAYNPEPPLRGAGPPDSASAAPGCLWVGSGTSQMGQVAIVSVQHPCPKVVECFNVESRVLCMLHVPAQEAPGGGAPGPTVCLGTEEGSVSVYKSSQGAKKVRLQQFPAPEKAAVMSLAGTQRSLYAGLVDGAVAVYAKAADGSWDPEPQKVIKFGVLPVRSLLVTEDTLWVASGGQVFVIRMETHTVESQLEAHQEEGMVVSHMAVAGVGIWIAFTSGSTLRLFHTETLRHLQDVNVATPVHHLLPGHQRLSVTSLLVGHGLLMAGTSLGVVVALPIPRLQGIPKVTGRGMVSYHAHSGPVKFLVVATAVPETDQDRPRDSPPPGAGPQDDDRQDAAPRERARPGLGPHGADALWLGAPLGSGPHRSELEPGCEDSIVYDLLRRPRAAPGEGQRPRVSSVLVVTGGQGHRRLGRRVRQPRPEELASSIMVWQVPLPDV